MAADGSLKVPGVRGGTRGALAHVRGGYAVLC